MQAAALYRSSIGKKALMALTGVVWVGYVLMHMYGNLKAFQGAEYFNHYAEGLRELGGPVFGHLHLLTIARIVLVASIVTHVWAAYSLWAAARQARPATYASHRMVQANYASITMRYGGTVILLFVLYHLAHLTWGVGGIHSDYIRGDAYHNLIVGFRSLPVVILYLVALVALGLHLYHGTWSMFQTLGFNDANWDKPLRALALLLAIVIPVGFAVVPLAIQFGFIA
jgi:succinate dehydrogenase / fumarate reductase cytochrome b subunit